jgi:hypothetical protein
MTFETEDRHGQSALQVPQPQPTQCASRDLVGDCRPLGDASSDWVRLREIQRHLYHGGPRTEWLWFNFPEPIALHDYRYLGTGFRERIKRKKQR